MKNIDLKWFTDRVGKVVYRNRTTCRCGVCDVIYTNGLLIQDEMHATYLYDVCGDYNNEGVPLRYFDTIKERDEFELTL